MADRPFVEIVGTDDTGESIRILVSLGLARTGELGPELFTVISSLHRACGGRLRWTIGGKDFEPDA